MARQVLVVGLGQFGMALARALVENGEEVLAVDRNPNRVQLAADVVHEALAMDAMDEDELARLRPSTRDVCVCAIGDDSREASIVVTALLRQMGAPFLLARATDPLHERILKLVGAHEVLNPERVVGERLAARLSHRGVIDVTPLGDGVAITEVVTPRSLEGRTLVDAQLPKRFALTVVAVRRPHGADTKVLLPTADLRLAPGDALVLVGTSAAADRLLREV